MCCALPLTYQCFRSRVIRKCSKFLLSSLLKFHLVKISSYFHILIPVVIAVIGEVPSVFQNFPYIDKIVLRHRRSLVVYGNTCPFKKNYYYLHGIIKIMSIIMMLDFFIPRYFCSNEIFLRSMYFSLLSLMLRSYLTKRNLK